MLRRVSQWNDPKCREDAMHNRHELKRKRAPPTITAVSSGRGSPSILVRMRFSTATDGPNAKPPPQIRLTSSPGREGPELIFGCPARCAVLVSDMHLLAESRGNIVVVPGFDVIFDGGSGPTNSILSSTNQEWQGRVLGLGVAFLASLATASAPLRLGQVGASLLQAIGQSRDSLRHTPRTKWSIMDLGPSAALVLICGV